MKIRRSGPVAVKSGPGGTLRVVIPLKFDGKVGFRGDGAKLLSLDKKRVDGKITITADVALDVTENWVVIANVNVPHRWKTKPRIEALDGVLITFQDKADKEIKKQRSKIGPEFDRALAKLDCVRPLPKRGAPTISRSRRVLLISLLLHASARPRPSSADRSSRTTVSCSRSGLPVFRRWAWVWRLSMRRRFYRRCRGCHRRVSRLRTDVPVLIKLGLSAR